MERLEMHWASKASCTQRTGRTGRVQTGYCFRLVTQVFYDSSLSLFSSPEMQRVALDRLILKIAQLNKKNKYDQIFNDPAVVLGRAIQPPILKNIKSSVSQLLDFGALFVFQDTKEDKLKITDIGRAFNQIPIDIKLGRLCLMGFLMGTMHDCIIIASILQQ